jgi:hypothetical protein
VARGCEEARARALSLSLSDSLHKIDYRPRARLVCSLSPYCDTGATVRWIDAVALATPEEPCAPFGYSNLQRLPDGLAAQGVGSAQHRRQRVGLTYETGDSLGCESRLGDSSACKIVYRTIEL